MKRFVANVKNLSQKASELQQVVQSLPPKISEFRESIAATAGQIQQLRTGIQSNAANLRVDSPDRLIEVLREIHDSAPVFTEAGFVLGGVDMELSPGQRLMVHLDKVEDVSHGSIRLLITANQNRPVIHALLSSLLQAEAVADRVALEHLSYRTLVVHVGPTPSVRLCWTSDLEEEETERRETPVPTSAAVAATTAAAATAPAVQPAAKSMFSQSSFFEPRTIIPTLTPATTVSSSPVVVVPLAASADPQPKAAEQAAETLSAETDWKKAALDRLKNSPHSSKYG